LLESHVILDTSENKLKGITVVLRSHNKLRNPIGCHQIIN